MINSGNHILPYQNKRHMWVDEGFTHLARQKLIDMQLRDEGVGHFSPGS